MSPISLIFVIQLDWKRDSFVLLRGFSKIFDVVYLYETGLVRGVLIVEYGTLLLQLARIFWFLGLLVNAVNESSPVEQDQREFV